MHRAIEGIRRSFAEDSWDIFHDGVLLDVCLCWRSGTTTLTVSMFGNVRILCRVTITATSFVEIPIQKPWGPSSSINRVQERSAGGGIQLNIEMQTGDTLRFAGRAIEVDFNPVES